MRDSIFVGADEEKSGGMISEPSFDASNSHLQFLYEQTKQMMGRVVDYKEFRMVYACAIKEVKTKFEILNTEFGLRYKRNPIASIKTRLKSTASIVSKLAKFNKPISIDNAEDKVNDIAGVRVICSYIDDIFLIAETFLEQDDVTLIEKKDYINNPKANGYRSLHLIVKIPVFLSERKLDVKVEVQIRTVAMEFWASLEHQLHYKQRHESTSEIVDELKKCAETIGTIDAKMLELREKVDALADYSSDDEELFERLSRIDMPIE